MESRKTRFDMIEGQIDEKKFSPGVPEIDQTSPDYDFAPRVGGSKAVDFNSFGAFGTVKRYLTKASTCPQVSRAVIDHIPISLTFGRHGGYHTITGRLQIQTRASSQTFWVARVFFPYGAQSGRRAR